MPPSPTEILRHHGLQVTAQRLAVLSAVCDMPHCTADDVAQHVCTGIGTISRQAVYDALRVLSEKHIIRRIEPPGSPARFERRVGDNHHHLICRKCGTTVDVDCAHGSAPCLKPAPSVAVAGFIVDEAEVIYWGICPDCQHPGLQRANPTSTNSNIVRQKPSR